MKKSGIVSLRTGALLAGIFGLFMASGFWVSKNLAPVVAQTEASKADRRIASIDPRLALKAKKKAAELQAAFEAGTLTPESFEADFFKGVATLYHPDPKKDQLAPALGYLIQSAREKGALGEFGNLSNAMIVGKLHPMIVAELASRGMAGDPSVKFADWKTLEKQQIALLDAQDAVAKAPVGSAKFKTDLIALTKSKLTGGNRVGLLSDPAESLKRRLQAIAEAKNSIYIMSWAIYGDVTGKQIVKTLVERKAKDRELDIKVMVDDLTAHNPAYSAVLSELEKGGIQVIRWKSLTAYPFYGLHRKVMTVDGKIGFQGGRNFGDEYFHQGTAKKWRDTDMSFEGPSVREAEIIFFDHWNKQVALQQKPSTWTGQAVASAPQVSGGKVEIAYVDHQPSVSGYDPVYLAALKAIRGAKRSIDIANAYFIARFAIQKELIAALNRGVKVRILTNSIQSVDEPIVSFPILASLVPYLQNPKPAKVFLKQGATLHSKYMVVDGSFGWVGSYNLHPRSLQYEGEMVLLTFDPDFAKAILRDYNRDLDDTNQTKVVNSIDDLQIPGRNPDGSMNPKSPWPFITQYFYNQL